MGLFYSPAKHSLSPALLFSFSSAKTKPPFGSWGGDELGLLTAPRALGGGEVSCGGAGRSPAAPLPSALLRGPAQNPPAGMFRLMKPIQSRGKSLLHHDVGSKARGAGAGARQLDSLGIGVFGCSNLGKSQGWGSLGDAPDTLLALSEDRTESPGWLTRSLPAGRKQPQTQRPIKYPRWLHSTASPQHRGCEKRAFAGISHPGQRFPGQGSPLSFSCFLHLLPLQPADAAPPGLYPAPTASRGTPSFPQRLFVRKAGSKLRNCIL